MTTTANIRKNIANEALEVARKATALRRSLRKVGWYDEADPALVTEVREFLKTHADDPAKVGTLPKEMELTRIALDYYDIFTANNDN